MKKVLRCLPWAALWVMGCTIEVNQNQQAISAEDVSILMVAASPISDPMDDDYRLEVRILVEIIRELPHMAPYIEVSGQCQIDGKTYSDEEKAFFMKLSKARPPARKEDSTELFFLPSLPKKPERCDLTLQLSKDSVTPHYYCYQNGTTNPGKCPT